MSAGEPPDDAQPDGPYRQLRAFEQEDERLFFGRSRERRTVAANLLGSRLTLLYGPSGVGKTSLLRAGVAAELAARWRRPSSHRQAAVVVYPLRRSWADPPLAGLMAGIAEQLSEATGERVGPWDGSRPAIETLREWTRDGLRILLVLDQFEEYLGYHPTEDGVGSLAGELPLIVGDPDLPVNVLIAIREDELARLDRFKATMPGLFDHYLRIDHLDESAARDAIVKPLAAWAEMGGAGPTGVDDEEALVRAVLDDDELTARASRDRSSPGGPDPGAVRRIETPYLQLVMSRLWDAERDLGSTALRVSTLRERLGGPAKIVNEHLAAAMRRMERERGPEATRLAGAAFAHLVTESGSKFALTASELARAIREPETEAAMAEALDVLCRRENRILRKTVSPEVSDGTRYELSHDVLGRAVQGWAAEAERRRLARARARARQRALAFAGAAVVMAALLALSLVAYQQLGDEKEATRSRQLASEANAGLSRDPARSLEKALDALDPRTDEAEEALRLAVAEHRLRRRAEIPKGVSDVASDAKADVLVSAGEGGLALFERRDPDDAVPLSTKSAFGVSVSADGRVAASIGVTGAWLWDLAACRASAADCRPGARLRLPAGYYRDEVALAQGAVGPDAPSPARYVAVAGSRYSPTPRSRVSVFDLRDAACGVRRVPGRRCRPVWVSEPLPDVQLSLAFSPDGSRLASGGADGVLRFWRRGGRGWAAAARPGLVVTREIRSVDGLAFSPDGRLGMATYKSAAVFDLDRCRSSGRSCPAVARYPHSNWVQAIAFGAGGTRVATGDDDGVVRVWDLETRGAALALRGNYGAIFGLRFGPAGALYSASSDKMVRQWDARRGRILTGHGDVVHDAAYSPPTESGAVELAATTSADGVIRLYDLGMCPGTPADARCSPVAERRLARPPTSIAFDARGARLVVGDRGGHARVLAVRKAGVVGLWPRRALFHPQQTLPSSLRAVNSAAFSPKGTIVTVGADYGVRLWDATSIPLPLTIPKGRQPFGAAFSRDGKLVAVAHAEGIQLWDVQDCLTDFICDPAVSLDTPAVNLSVAFAEDGRLAAGGNDGVIRVWDRVRPPNDVAEPRELTGHTGSVAAVAFDRSGELVASAGVDGTTRVWEAATGAVRGVLHEHGDQVISVAFTKDGRILSGSEDRTARIYDCPSCADLDSVVDLAGRLRPKPFGE